MTVLKTICGRDGHVYAQRTIGGRFGIPSPAFGSVGGLSADGRTLVLEQLDRVGVLRPASRFVVLDTHGLQLRKRVVFRGDYAFDALSPDGSLLYLVERLDQLRYRVRAYDVERGRLSPSAVADYRDGDTTMRGWPIARAEHAGWAYTLYVGGSRSFVHALDTVHARAVCIFLPWQTEGTLYGGTLTLHGTRLRARLYAHGFPPVTIETQTLHVT